VIVLFTTRLLQAQDLQTVQISETQSMSCPNSGSAPPMILHNDPRTCNSMRYVQVAVHFILPTTATVTYPLDATTNYIGAGNFTETSDGNGNVNFTGFQFAEATIAQANDKLANNKLHWRKEPSLGEEYYKSIPKIGFRYLLVGVFFHRSRSAYYDLTGTNDGISDLHTKYNYKGNEVMDIYYAPRVWDTDLAGEAQSLGGLNKGVVMDDYFTYIKTPSWLIGDADSDLLNHEIGHMLDLAHTWDEDDKCDDTPMGFEYYTQKDCDLLINANCWRHSDNSYNGKPCPGEIDPCNDWAHVSNNVMDYNEERTSFTMCQVGRMENNLNGSGQSYLKQRPNCESCPPPNAFFWTNKSSYNFCDPNNIPEINFVGVGVNENEFYIDIQEDGKDAVTVAQGNGAVGNYNLASLFHFEPGKTYKIILKVNNTICDGEHEYSKTIRIKSCDSGSNSGSDPNNPIFPLVATNPVYNTLNITATLEEEGEFSMTLINQFSGVKTILQDELEITSIGTHQFNFDIGNLPQGTYVLQSRMNQTIVNNIIIKP
jgi:hypothetical protein